MGKLFLTLLLIVLMITDLKQGVQKKCIGKLRKTRNCAKNEEHRKRLLRVGGGRDYENRAT